MKRIDVHPSLQLAWIIANSEACLTATQRIEPVHFLLASLKMIDIGFEKDAKKIGLPREAINTLAYIADKGRKIIGILDKDITSLRRSLRKSIQGNKEPNEIQMLHRSEASRELFRRAAQRALDANSIKLTLLHLIEELSDNLPIEAKTFFKKRQPIKSKNLTSAAAKSDDAAWKIEEEDKPKPDKTSTPILDEMGRDLTALAHDRRLTPVIGRKSEMTALVRYLQRTSKRNVILIGDAGVGKTAVVEGLAQRLAQKDTPEFLQELRIVQISVADLVSGTKYRGDMEERLQRIVSEAIADPNLVLFIDEIHLVIKAGSSRDASMDIANILKPALARDEFRCIGATTTEEFERHIKNDAAFMRRFQVLRVKEPSTEEAINICNEWARRIEKIQQVKFEDDAIKASVSLSAKLIFNRSLPDKAIDLLENAATFVKVSSLSLRNIAPTKEIPRVKKTDVEAVLEEQYGISARISEVLDPARLKSLLCKEIVGQDEAIKSLTDALSALEMGKSDAERPLGVFMFIGPTGVGKTFAVECIERALFGAESKVLGRFNMNEYKERHELARLIGAPPGFIGHEQTGSLFKFIEANAQGIILLDEMEKAHPEIQDYFLQIFDKGESMDSRGRNVSFRRHLFLITCNIFAASEAESRIGFNVKDKKLDQSNEIYNILLKHFRSEFLGRIDRIIVFQPLVLDDYQLLLNRRIENLSEGINQMYEMKLEIQEEVMQNLCNAAMKQKDGARGFIRLVEQSLIVPLYEYIKALPNKKNRIIEVNLSDDKPSFSLI